MNRIVRLIPIFIFCLCLQSCNSENVVCDSSSDTLCGTWNLFSTSGGFSGGGYNAKFDKLKIDSDLNFEILNGSTLLASGDIEEIEHQHFEYYVRFNADIVNTTENINLISDNEKSIEFIEDKLHLVSDCCDRYNTLLERD